MSNGQIPLDDNGKPIVAGYDATGHQIVAAEIVSVTTDSTTGIKHGALNVNASFSASSLSINDPVTTANKATVDGSGNLHVAIGGALASGTNTIGGVELVDSGGTNKALISAGGAVKVDNSAVTQPVSGTVTATTNADTTIGGTSAPSKELLVAGKTNDGTPQYQPIPEGAGGRSVIVEGVAGGTNVGISGTVTANAGTNLNTSALALETGGNLATLAGAVSSSKVQSNTAQINGVAPSVGNGVSGTGVQRVTLASDSTGQVALAAGSAVIGSTTIQATSGTALAADQSNTELRVSNYVKSSTAGDTALSLGQATMANSLPVTMASNQGAVAVGPVAGTAFDTNEGTAGANTLRVIAAGAATGTKSNVASSASSVTILASNTSRKGAMIYNDSTQILYLDLSGSTASSSSYSLQIPANGFFELPGPNLYNGAITGIWAAANGNAHVTEFS